MNASLHDVKISWDIGEKRKESNVTNALIPVVSMISKGNVERVWYEKSSRYEFECSFALINLRANAQDHVFTSLKLASVTYILILFCEENMFT